MKNDHSPNLPGVVVGKVWKNKPEEGREGEGEKISA